MRSLNKNAFEHDTQEALFSKTNQVLVDLNEYYHHLESSEKSAEEILDAKSLVAEELFNKLLAYHQEISNVRPPNNALFEAVFSVMLKNINVKDIENEKVIAIFKGTKKK